MDELFSPTGPVFVFVKDTLVENLSAIMAIWMLMTAVTWLLPSVKAHHLYARIETVAPLLLGIALVFIPGWIVDEDLAGVGARVFRGINLGGLAMVGFKLWRQTILGKDPRIEARLRGEVPDQDPPAPPPPEGGG